MNPVVALAPRFRLAGGRDARVTTALAVTAFAVSTALTLSVAGGALAFAHRAAHPSTRLEATEGGFYVALAWVAVVLLVVPLLTLAGAAARLGVSRRDERLSTLRLLGATPREVVALTVLETSWQGLVGAVLGLGLAAALLPVWALVPFQGRRFAPTELWPGWWALLGPVLVPVLAVVSAAWSLRRVLITPLGVARREGGRAPSVARLVLFALAVGVFVAVTKLGGAFGAAAVTVLLGALALGFAALNLVGPWLLGVIGRRQARRASTPQKLLAARRLAADPRAAWRVVGGLSLAGFVAGVLAVVPSLLSGSGRDRDQLGQDLLTGALLTLGIAFALAAVSAGIAQAAAVLDRRRELALQRLAGVPAELFDAVRRREVLVPVLVVGVGSALVAVAMLLPLLGLMLVDDVRGPLLLVGALMVGVLVVLAATETSRPLLRAVLADTVVRAD